MDSYNDVLRLDAFNTLSKAIVGLRYDMVRKWREVDGNTHPEVFKLELIKPRFRNTAHCAAAYFDPQFPELGKTLWKVVKTHLFDTFSPTKEEDFYKVAYETAEACAKVFFSDFQAVWLKRYFPNGATKPEEGQK